MTGNLSFDEQTRYSQQMMLCELGEHGQQFLKQASVAVIGAGGLGCPALAYLVGAGVGSVRIIDPDRVDLTNLHRQVLYTTEDIGQHKCVVAQRQLYALNPNVACEAVTSALTDQNGEMLLRGCHLIIDATDNMLARRTIDHACDKLRIPWIYAAIHRFTAHISVFVPGGLSYRDLFPAASQAEHMQSCSDSGVLGPLPGIAGAIEALEAIKILTRQGSSLASSLLVVDAWTWQTRRYAFGALNVENYALSPETVRRMLAEGEKITFLDLRCFHEDLADFVSTLSGDAVVVVCCQRGIRSAAAVRVARQRCPSAQVYSLDGGIADFGENLQ